MTVCSVTAGYNDNINNNTNNNNNIIIIIIIIIIVIIILHLDHCFWAIVGWSYSGEL